MFNSKNCLVLILAILIIFGCFSMSFVHANDIDFENSFDELFIDKNNHFLDSEINKVEEALNKKEKKLKESNFLNKYNSSLFHISNFVYMITELDLSVNLSSDFEESYNYAFDLGLDNDEAYLYALFLSGQNEYNNVNIESLTKKIILKNKNGKNYIKLLRFAASSRDDKYLKLIVDNKNFLKK
ncbi:MAG: hypothetical protein ACI4V7_07950 [Succinivibrionaceae bacterium]